jgi:hypothetical protein
MPSRSYQRSPAGDRSCRRQINATPLSTPILITADWCACLPRCRRCRLVRPSGRIVISGLLGPADRVHGSHARGLLADVDWTRRMPSRVGARRGMRRVLRLILALSHRLVGRWPAPTGRQTRRATRSGCRDPDSSGPDRVWVCSVGDERGRLGGLRSGDSEPGCDSAAFKLCTFDRVAAGERYRLIELRQTT